MGATFLGGSARTTEQTAGPAETSSLGFYDRILAVEASHLRRKDRPQVVNRRGFELQTERLRLRSLDESDVEALHRVLGDQDAMVWYPAPFTRQQTQNWIRRWMESYEERGHGLWAVELRATGELIGDVGLALQHVDGEDLVEVGWHTRRDMWGRGYATEGGLASVQWGFDHLEVDRIISLIRPENVASWRVAEKLGLEPWRDTMRGPGQGWLHRVYSVTREEWERRTAATGR